MAIPAPRPLSAVPASPTVISIRALKTRCSNCSMRELCLPVGLEQDALQQLDQLVTNRVRLKKGQVLYRAGDPFSALYGMRMGSCKTTVLAENGHEQVVGYHMLGDVIGMDGIGTDRHGCQAVALEKADIAFWPFTRLAEFAAPISPRGATPYH